MRALCPQYYWDNEPGLLSTSPYIPIGCLNAPVSDPATAIDYFNVLDSYTPLCFNYPVTTDGVAVNFSNQAPPLRTALDQKARTPSNIVWGDPLDTDCAATLNETVFCPTAHGCTWQSFNVGIDQGVDECRYAGWGYDAGFPSGSDHRCNCSGINMRCQSRMSLCFKTRADPTFLSACCLGEWPTGVSQSVDVPLGIAKHPELPILAPVAVNQTSLPDPLTVSNTVKMNPFQMACDPRWCLGSPACDSIMYETCQWSITAMNGSSRSALLAPSGVCGEWYRTFTSQGIVGPNSFALIDSIVNSYCVKSATALGDTTSCACVDPHAKAFYVWHSEDGVTSHTYQATAVNSNSFDSIAVSDYVCSNPFCIAAFHQETSFITSGLLARKTTCPTQTCMQVNLGLTVSIASITAGGYIDIGSTEFLCAGSRQSISSDVPLLDIQPLNPVWFYNNGEYLNPDNQAEIVIRNRSQVSPYVQVTFGGLPDWLTPVTLPEYPVATNSTNVFLLAFNADKAPGPLATTMNVTVTALKDQTTPFSPSAAWIAPMNLSIVDISMPVPEQPPAPKPRTDARGLPLLLIGQLTIGGAAMVVLSVCMILFSLFLVVNNLINANASRIS